MNPYLAVGLGAGAGLVVSLPIFCFLLACFARPVAIVLRWYLRRLFASAHQEHQDPEED
jgi:hypothetical protein